MSPNRNSLEKTITWKLEGQSVSSALFAPKNTKQLISLIEGTFKSEIVRMFRRCTGSLQFVDVGVNTGQTMMEILKLFPDTDYYGFEPNPDAYCCAQALAKANSFSVKLFPWACSHFSGPLDLYTESSLDSSATSMASIRPNTYSQIQPFKIASYPLDSILKNDAQHGFILKIDVEGSENEVLLGARKLIKNKRPLICCEVLHAHRECEIGMNNQRKKSLQEFLARQDYKIYSIILNPIDREKFIGIKKISSFPLNALWKNSPHTCDYLFVPNEIPDALVHIENIN